MHARATAIGIVSAIAVMLPVPSAPTFTLQSTGAVHLRADGPEARYGFVPEAIRGGPILMVSLGAAKADGALQLARLGDRLPAPGRYPIRSSWDEPDNDAGFHASFMPGTAEHPLGWFQGESGWVTITEAREGRIAGAFEVRARGFAADDPIDEDKWVTVRGTFDARGKGGTAVGR